MYSYSYTDLSEGPKSSRVVKSLIRVRFKKTNSSQTLNTRNSFIEMETNWIGWVIVGVSEVSRRC